VTESLRSVQKAMELPSDLSTHLVHKYRIAGTVGPVNPVAPAPSVPAHEGAPPRVGYLIYRVERRLRVRLDEAVRAHGVTTTEYVTLSVLRERDGLSCAQLARWAFVTPQAMNLVVKALERRGLVRRRPDPRHGRVLRASVTSKGLVVLEACDHSMDGIEAAMLEGLPPETLGAVRSVLTSCARSLEATTPQPDSGPMSFEVEVRSAGGDATALR
jgi:DNA-binding MarR family transcriptional regulator